MLSCDGNLQQALEYLTSVPKLAQMVRGGFLEEVTSGLGSEDVEVLGGGWGWEGLCWMVWLSLVAQSYPTFFHPMNCNLPGSPVHGDSPGKKTGVGCHALLQEIFMV